MCTILDKILLYVAPGYPKHKIQSFYLWELKQREPTQLMLKILNLKIKILVLPFKEEKVLA